MLLVSATGAVNGPAGFAVFCCRIARQLKVLHVSWKYCPSVRSSPLVRSIARQVEVLRVCWKYCPLVKYCTSLRSIAR